MDGLVLYDPLHGGCLRVIRRTSPTAYCIHGVYGDDEPPHARGAYWSATLEVRERGAREWRLLVDFAGKPGKVPRQMTAAYVPAERCIRWSDGNVWRVLYVARAQLSALRGGGRRPRPPLEPPYAGATR